MSTKLKTKECFEVEAKFGAFYTGGNIEWHQEHLYCQNLHSIAKVNINTGIVIAHIGKEDKTEDADTIQTFTCDHTGRLVTAHKSGLLKLWDSDHKVEKVWKYIHKGPLASLHLRENYLLSGGSDSIIRVWDLEHQACVSALRGCQGVINVLKVTRKDLLAFGSGDDGKINAWNLRTGKLLHSYSGHFSKATCLEFNYDDTHFVSAGRDKVLILWQTGQSQALRTIPVYEGIESLIVLPQKFSVPNYKATDGFYVAIGGERGLVRVWDVNTSKEIFAQQEKDSLVTPAKQEGGLSITKLIVDSKDDKCSTIGVVSAEQNIILLKRKTFQPIKQLIGFTDEILDICFCSDDKYIAIATNSPDIKLYNSDSMNCQLLKGHTDIVMSLANATFDEELLMSASKDNTLRLWSLETFHCVCVALGHNGSVISCTFFTSEPFAVSGSRDTCIKVWKVPQNSPGSAQKTLQGQEEQLQCIATQIGHEKDINMVAVSPNDKLIASCSQDKTIKLWSENLNLLGVLKGHKRGVWCVRFSPVDQVLVSSSADCSIKLWSVADFNCLKTLQGHEASVLRVEFLSNGLQLLSAGADGLLKLFDIKTSEAKVTLSDEHEARIWAVAVKKDESFFVTGGSDSTLIRWKDVTQERLLEARQKAEENVLEEQKLSNYLHEGKLLKALKLALRLEKPSTVMKIIKGVLKNGDEKAQLGSTIEQLAHDQKESLLKCATEWNKNSRHSEIAQIVINLLLIEMQKGTFKADNLQGFLESNLPYTERHFKRVTEMMEDLQFISYTINRMQPHAKT